MRTLTDRGSRELRPREREYSLAHEAQMCNHSAVEVSRQQFVFVLLCFLLSASLCLALTRQSLWIDEAVTAWMASRQSVWSVLAEITNSQHIKVSEPYMPFFYIYIWAWARVFGTSEFALRASNIPFAIVLVTTFGWTSLRVFNRPFLWAVFGLSPFIWFYINEARPYIAVMACSAISLAALLPIRRDTQGSHHGFSVLPCCWALGSTCLLSSSYYRRWRSLVLSSESRGRTRF